MSFEAQRRWLDSQATYTEGMDQWIRGSQRYGKTLRMTRKVTSQTAAGQRVVVACRDNADRQRIEGLLRQLHTDVPCDVLSGRQAVGVEHYLVDDAAGGAYRCTGSRYPKGLGSMEE